LVATLESVTEELIHSALPHRIIHGIIDLSPGTRLGVYEVTARIGEGGMGQVYRARDTRLKREISITVLPAAFDHDPDRLARFHLAAEEEGAYGNTESS